MHIEAYRGTFLVLKEEKEFGRKERRVECSAVGERWRLFLLSSPHYSSSTNPPAFLHPFIHLPPLSHSSFFSPLTQTLSRIQKASEAAFRKRGGREREGGGYRMMKNIFWGGLRGVGKGDGGSVLFITLY